MPNKNPIWGNKRGRYINISKILEVSFAEYSSQIIADAIAKVEDMMPIINVLIIGSTYASKPTFQPEKLNC